MNLLHFLLTCNSALPNNKGTLWQYGCCDVVLYLGGFFQTRDTGGNETEQPLLEPVSCSDWPRLVLRAHCDPFLHLLLFCTKLHSHSHIPPFELLLISCLRRIVSPWGITDPFVHCCKGDAICKKRHRRRHLPPPCPDIGFGTGLHREVWQW